MKLLKRLFSDEEGAGLVEYALLVALIAIVAIAGITALGTEIGSIFNRIGDYLKGKTIG